jgi:cellulose biosynthesis protein BcsQ
MDHKAGVSQTALGIAESLAENYPYLKVLLIHMEGRSGREYAPQIRENLETIRPYLQDRVLDGRETGEKAQYKGNLYIVGGDENPGSAETYLPDMAEYLLASFAEVFDVVLCDSGSELEHAMALGALFSADRLYYVLTQSELCFRRAEWLLPLYEKLGLAEGRFILSRCDKNSPFSASYSIKRLQTDPDAFSSVRLSRRGADAEIEGRSLYSYKESGYRKDIDLIAEEIVSAFGLVKGGKERKWLRKSSASTKY